MANKGDVAAAERGVARGDAIGEGIALAKDLGNLPGNVCTPTYLAEQAQELGKRHGMKVEVLERKDMEKLGMGCFLAVAQGSRAAAQAHRARVPRRQARTRRRWRWSARASRSTPAASRSSPRAEMDEMKFDMCGAASVLGTMRAIALMRLPINVVGVIPATENMPGGNAIKPGDIVTTMSGQTVEILNTDAEGRLILCDALTYVEKFKPAAVIDIATLTGAMVIALGHVATGMFANSDTLAREVIDAGDAVVGPRLAHAAVGRLPGQCSSRTSPTSPTSARAPAARSPRPASCRASPKAYPWAHLDIAGTAWKSGAEKGATGRPVALLSHFLAKRAA